MYPELGTDKAKAEYAAGVCPACEDLDIDGTGSAVRAALLNEGTVGVIVADAAG